MKERPILFSAPMVRALLSGQKTQTRRVVNLPADAKHVCYWAPSSGRSESGYADPGVNYWTPDPAGETDSNHLNPCPYGQPGDRLLCYHCAHEHTSPRTSPDSGIPERRLHGGVGRADLQPHQVRGVRSQDPSGLVSAQGARHEEGLRDDHHVARRKEGNEGGSSVGLHGLSRHAADAERGDAAPGWQRVKQCAGQPLLGNGGRELAGQAHARDCGDGREAPRSEVHGCGTGAYPLGNQQGLVQPAARGACAGCGAVVDSGHRIGGDRLYVRETWAAPHAYDHLPPRLIPQDARIHYAATEDRGGLLCRPSIHMPRWASRILLEITAVRVERLQDISEADAVAEGVDFAGHTDEIMHDYSPDERFSMLWESINGAGSWNENPWVWVVEFRRVEA